MIPVETLMPYQQVGAEWLSQRHDALLADEMGLGKTGQAISACDMIGAKNILVVCKTNAVINWSREFTKFSPMDRPVTLIRTGTDRPRHGVTVISYDFVTIPRAKRAIAKAKLAINVPVAQRRAEIARKIERDRRELLAAIKAIAWDVIIIDEAHYLKERESDRTIQVYGNETARSGLIHAAKRRWRLTGTPALNNAGELWTHLKTAGVYERPYWDFVFQFCTGFDGDYGYKITGTKNEAQLRLLLDKFMLRRKKDQVMKDLPDVLFSTVTVDKSDVEFDPWFFENYQSIGIEAFQEQLKNIDASLKNSLNSVRGVYKFTPNLMKIIEAYAHTTSTLRRYIGLAKAPKVLEIIEQELEEGAYQKIVIFAMHQQVIEMARQRFRKYGVVTLYGGTPASKRQANIDSFQNDPKTRVFVGQVHAAGDSITLTAANEIAFIEADWVPATNAQSVARCHRYGQTKKVRVRFFVCAETVDEEVMRVVAQKTREIAKFID